MPERPTSDQIAECAAKLKDPASDRAGICLRSYAELSILLGTVFMIQVFGRASTMMSAGT